MSPEQQGRVLPALDSVDQITILVRRFYARVRADDLLGPVFNEVVQVDWDVHLPKLTAFWARALLGIEGYQGNPFARHADAHAASPLTPAHFDRWLALFEKTIDAGWAGPNVERARNLAHNVARVHAQQLGVTEKNALAVTAGRGSLKREGQRYVSDR